MSYERRDLVKQVVELFTDPLRQSIPEGAIAAWFMFNDSKLDVYTALHRAGEQIQIIARSRDCLEFKACYPGECCRVELCVKGLDGLTFAVTINGEFQHLETSLGGADLEAYEAAWREIDWARQYDARTCFARPQTTVTSGI